MDFKIWGDFVWLSDSGIRVCRILSLLSTLKREGKAADPLRSSAALQKLAHYGSF
jgi:hypothetical protein